MKEEIKTLKVFIANDGKEFTSEQDCKKYEEGVLKDKKNIKYFEVRHRPDLTETGCLQECLFVAVLSTNYYHDCIVYNWCVKEKGFPILGEGVQGYGFQKHFSVSASTEEAFFASQKGRKISSMCWDDGRVFLSPKAVEGFPEKFDYIKKWGFK